jgi:hypothetical protein
MDLSGDWRLEVTFLRGTASHSLHLEQEGERVRGRYRTQYGEQDIAGHVDGDGTVHLRSSVHHEACGAPYLFTGTAQDACLAGDLALGEYWTARWRAERLA